MKAGINKNKLQEAKKRRQVLQDRLEKTSSDLDRKKIEEAIEDIDMELGDPNPVEPHTISADDSSLFTAEDAEGPASDPKAKSFHPPTHYPTPSQSMERDSPSVEPPSVERVQETPSVARASSTRRTPGAESGPSAGSDAEVEFLYTPPQARKDLGLENQGKIVAWAKRHNSKPVIVRYGPPSAAKYVLSTASRQDDFLDEDTTPRFDPASRLADKTDKDNKFERQVKEIKGILGVAFVGHVSALEPKSKALKKEPGIRAIPYPTTYVKIQWEIGDTKPMSWETRSSLKRFYRGMCDGYIYQAALHSEQRHNLWKAKHGATLGTTSTGGAADVDSTPVHVPNKNVADQSAAAVTTSPADKTVAPAEKAAIAPGPKTTLEEELKKMTREQLMELLQKSKSG